MASRVVALVEHPAADAAAEGEGADGGSRRGRSRRASPDQPSLELG
jgi:hypothetical protein